MRIIIAGAGDVGFHLAKLLSVESQDILLIDNNADKLQYAQNHIDVSPIMGDCNSTRILKEAQVSKAELLIAVTNSQAVNMTTCIIGKKMGAKRTIARITDVDYVKQKAVDFRELGVDELISPEMLAAEEIKQLLKENAVTDSYEFEDGKLSLVGVLLDKPSPIIGKSLMELSELEVTRKFNMVALLRKGVTLIPRGNTKLRYNDNAYFIARTEAVKEIIELTGKETIGIKNIMFLGGSQTCLNTVSRLPNKYQIKIIEKDKDRCFKLADRLPNALIVHGDVADVDLLEEEGISHMDAVIALTGNAETNILSCLVAKNRGVNKTIALIENNEYIHLSQRIGLDTIINKKLLAANSIFRYIREGDVISMTGIHGIDAEILEFEVHANAKITQSPLKELNFPETAVIGGYIRDNKEYIASGDTQIIPNDRVVVFSLHDCIHKVEDFFK